MLTSGLPIDAVLPALREALARSPSAVLQAPPGAGKSTVVPLALLDEPWAAAAGKRILMLEPRRLAARAVAQRMAQTLGEPVGRTVGYRMRMDTRVSRDTRIEVVTEGVLTRMLQNDPALEGVAAVIFDEFHERSLQADLGLALVLDARENLAPELKVLVMSATLDGVAVARLLGDAPVITSEGRMFPVESRFAAKGAPLLPGPPGPGASADTPEKITAQLVMRALREETGDILVFLPGAREIRRVQSLLESAEGARVFPLFGELSPEDQDAALTPSARGARKVVLATNIAETSLTIQGVRVVIDSGLVRRSMFDPSTGMSRLETQRISRASADQRQGRAGRTEPGVCYRAWSEGAHRSLAPFTPPEIMEADLIPLALDLANWGARDASALRWLDVPPASMLASARDVLQRLGALESDGRITAHGREMASIGVHPRFAHMLLRARSMGRLALAADLAALLAERDLLRGAGSVRDADIRTRIEVLRQTDGPGSPPGVDRFGLQRARRSARDLLRQVEGSNSSGRDRESGYGGEDAGVVLAFAYPDRIGRRRPGADGRYTLTNGRGAYFAEPQGLAKSELIVAVDLDDRERDARILLAAPLTRSDIEEHFPERLRRVESVEWSSREQAVVARRAVQLDSIVLEEKPLPEIPADAARAAMLTGVRELGMDALPWTRDARDLQARIEFARKLHGSDRSEGNAGSSWPAVSDADLAATVETWLAPWLDGVTRKEHLARIPLIDVLRSLLTWDQQRELDDVAPTHLQVPSGSQIRIDYLDQSAPAISVRLQEVFGLDTTPRIGNGRIPVTFKLLSPAQRPVQVTRDLASFWRGSYADVRKDMRGRYPKHYWPENPLEAQPTRGVRRKS
jgi:ATP-dependent RNA helicase HrpB